MLDELDFKKEAANQEVFRTFLKESGIDHEVTAPKVFPEASTERVLTMVSPSACWLPLLPDLMWSLNVWLRRCGYFNRWLCRGFWV